MQYLLEEFQEGQITLEKMTEWCQVVEPLEDSF
jgi:hypothetical protein